jgi:hypothetical protein
MSSREDNIRSVKFNIFEGRGEEPDNHVKKSNSTASNNQSYFYKMTMAPDTEYHCRTAIQQDRELLYATVEE